MTTTAQQIAAALGDDGSRRQDEQGRTLEELVEAAGGRADWRDGRGTDVVRYTFADGSVLTAAGPAWDLGFPGCYCWQGAGHTEACTERKAGAR